jgi:hypothetical protein
MLRLHEFYVSFTAYLHLINNKCLYLVFLKNQATLLTYKRNINILQGSSYPTMILHYVLLVPLTRAACPTLDNVIPYQWPERFSLHDQKFNRVLSLECPSLALRCTFFSLLRATDFFLLQNVQTGSGAHTFNWYRWSFSVVKWLGRKVNHSHQTSAGVKNNWSHTSTTPMILHAVDTENFSIYTTESLLQLEFKYIIPHDSSLALFCQYS